MKYLIKFSYDGSKFHGFQRQKNQINVQSELEGMLSKIYKDDIFIKGSGRTDAKVHAINQYAHFESTKKINFLKFKLNKKLKYIRIKSIKKVNENFHARFSVKEKTYVYKLSQNKKDNKCYYGYYYYNLDLKLMNEAKKLFIGTHNFKNFVAGYRDNYESIIFDIKIYKVGKRIYFVFKGHGFYRYMVRNLVGALIDVGRGKVDIDILKNMLVNYNDEKRLNTAKAEGLYLKNIRY